MFESNDDHAELYILTYSNTRHCNKQWKVCPISTPTVEFMWPDTRHDGDNKYTLSRVRMPLFPSAVVECIAEITQLES